VLTAPEGAILSAFEVPETLHAADNEPDLHGDSRHESDRQECQEGHENRFGDEGQDDEHEPRIEPA
jgi:hypothetical protein